MKQLWEYTKRVFGQWEYVYGVIALILTVFAVLSSAGTELMLPAWAWVLILLLSLYWGTFSVYRKIVEERPKPADLTIKEKSAVFRVTSWGGGVPVRCGFLVTLDLINRGQEQATLNDLKLTEFDMNTSLLGDQPLRTRLYRPNDPHAGVDIRLPYKVPGGHWEPDVKFEIQVRYNAQGPLEFAERLNELQDFEIVLQYKYEDMQRSKYEDSIEIRGSFEGFKKPTPRI